MYDHTTLLSTGFTVTILGVIVPSSSSFATAQRSVYILPTSISILPLPLSIINGGFPDITLIILVTVLAALPDASVTS